MFREMPEEGSEGDSDGKALLTFVQNAIVEGLNASLRSSTHLPGSLFLLRCWLKVQPNQQIQADTTGAALLRVLANLVKIHTANGPDPVYRLIVSVLDVVRDRMADLKDQRRHLISILGTLTDRSTNLTLCRYLLDMVRQWVLHDAEPTSEGKEKADLLLKMAAFEHREEALYQKYLDVVYEVYDLDVLRGTDITHLLEPAFLLGTKSRNPLQRARFLNKLEQSLPRTLDARLQYLYSLQNWDTLADSYWIPQILSMLLSLADPFEPFLRRPVEKIQDADVIPGMGQDATVGDIIRPALNLIHLDPDLAHQLWVAVFPLCWASLTRIQQTGFTGYIIKLLSKEIHYKQVEMRPNVIGVFLGSSLVPRRSRSLRFSSNIWQRPSARGTLVSKSSPSSATSIAPMTRSGTAVRARSASFTPISRKTTCSTAWPAGVASSQTPRPL